MTKHQNAVPKDMASPPASSMGIPRNWRSELGIFWRDIEEAGSVTRAIRLRSPAAPVPLDSGAVERLSRHEGSLRADRWALFRTLGFSIL